MLAHEIDGLRRALGASALRRVPPHITLVPPVNIRVEEVDGVLAHVRDVASTSPSIRLKLGPPETFFPRTPVVYLAVDGDIEELGTLRGRLLAGPLTEPPGRVRDRPFVPHLTLDQSIAPGRIGAALEALASYRASFTFTRVVVLEFSEEERMWRSLADYEFAEPRLIGRGGIEVVLTSSDTLAPEAERFRDQAWDDDVVETYGPAARRAVPFAITARVGGELVGTANGERREDVVRLANLIVAREWRSSGIGSKLLAEVEHLAREHGTRRVRLEARAGSRAEAFYRGRGYRSVARLPAWRHGSDFTLMEREL